MLRRALYVALFGLLAAPALAQSNDPSFRIVNNSGKAINEVYASPSNTRNWGHDRLGNEVIPAGASYIIRIPIDGNCVFDVRVVYQGGSADERRNVNTCNLTDFVVGGGAARPPAAAQGNPSFNLVNQSGRRIEQFYASPSSAQGWGSDRLGDNTISAGQTFAVRLPLGECSYDLRWVFQGGAAQERRNVNTCSVNNYVVR